MNRYKAQGLAVVFAVAATILMLVYVAADRCNCPKEYEAQRITGNRQSIERADRSVRIWPTTTTSTTTTSVPIAKARVSSASSRVPATTTRSATPAKAPASNRYLANPEKLRMDIASCEGYPKYINSHHPGSSSASGKYGYVIRTWNNYGGFREAYLAPEHIQDQRAREDIARGWGQVWSNWSASYHCWSKK